MSAQLKVGSIVLYSMARNADFPEIPAVVVAGLVQKVQEDGTVNLLTSDDKGYPLAAVGIMFVVEGAPFPEFDAFAYFDPQSGVKVSKG